MIELLLLQLDFISQIDFEKEKENFSESKYHERDHKDYFIQMGLEEFTFFLL